MSSDSEDDYIDSDGDVDFDEKDQKWLASLNDVEREEYIYEQKEKQKEAEERRKIQRESRGKGKESSKPLKIKRKQAVAIDDIRKKQQSKKSKYADMDSSESKDEEHDPYDLYTNKRKLDELTVCAKGIRERQEELEEVEVEITLSDIQKCVVTRDTLEKWYSEPFFLRELPGVFVKVAVDGFGSGGRVYKLAEIQGFSETSKVYKLGKIECRHMASLKIGEGNLKTYEMEYVSNSPLGDVEYLHWLDIAKRQNDVPTKEHLELIALKLDGCKNYVYTPEDWRDQIKKNKEKVTNPSVEILRLKTLLLEETNPKKEEELKKKIAAAEQREIEKNLKSQGKLATSLSAINKRNEKINTVLTRTVIDEDEYNPDEGSAFKQAPTKSRNAWVAKPRGKVVNNDNNDNKEASEPDNDVEPSTKKQKTNNTNSNNNNTPVLGLSDIDIQLDSNILLGDGKNIRTPSTGDFGIIGIGGLKVGNSTSQQQQAKPKTVSSDTKILSFADYKKRMALPHQT